MGENGTEAVMPEGGKGAAAQFHFLCCRLAYFANSISMGIDSVSTITFQEESSHNQELRWFEHN